MSSRWYEAIGRGAMHRYPGLRLDSFYSRPLIEQFPGLSESSPVPVLVLLHVEVADFGCGVGGLSAISILGRLAVEEDPNLR